MGAGLCDCVCVCVCLYPPGCWTRRGAVPKGGTAVTSLTGAGGGVGGTAGRGKEGFSPHKGAYLRSPHLPG